MTVLTACGIPYFDELPRYALPALQSAWDKVKINEFGNKFVFTSFCRDMKQVGEKEPSLPVMTSWIHAVQSGDIARPLPAGESETTPAPKDVAEQSPVIACLQADVAGGSDKASEVVSEPAAKPHTYRSKLVNITGVASLRKMTEQQLQSVVEVFRKEGFQHRPKATASRRVLSGPFVGKMRALWIAAYNLGVANDREDSAMLAFIQRQAKVDDTRFLYKAKDARSAIEGLKGWLARDGGVDWSDVSIMPDYARADGFKIAWAQWRLLGGTSNADSVSRFRREVEQIVKLPPEECARKDWQKVMNHLGRKVRAARTARK